MEATVVKCRPHLHTDTGTDTNPDPVPTKGTRKPRVQALNTIREVPASSTSQQVTSVGSQSLPLGSLWLRVALVGFLMRVSDFAAAEFGP